MKSGNSRHPRHFSRMVVLIFHMCRVYKSAGRRYASHIFLRRLAESAGICALRHLKLASHGLACDDVRKNSSLTVYVNKY